MKRLIILLTIFLALGIVNAQETYRFRTDAPQGFSVTSSSASQLSLHYSIQELGIANIENGDVKGQEIILKGQFAPNAEGHPNLPVVNRFVAVPQGATVSLQVKENASTVLTDIDLLPAMPAQCDLDDKDVKLRWEASVFSKDANFPTENTVLSAPTQIRKLDVVILSVTPFRYNPVRKTLEVIYDIDIDIHFEGGNGQFGESRYLNPDWEHILRNLVINSDMIPTVDYYNLIKEARERDEDGWEYLIIAPDNNNYLAWADTLKAFRTKQGISTKIATISECGGNNPNSIRNYILNAYNNWAVPPAAVLLFGGWCNNSGIKPFYHVTVADSSYNSTRYPTDYPYCDMNGDSLADLAISRITARDPNEYRIFVEKTIQYESNPPTDPNYYDRPIFSTGHEANKWFLLGSQSIHGFLRDKVGKHPINLYMVNSGSIPTTTWSTGYNASVVVDYFGPNGQNYIEETPAYMDDWVTKNDSILLYDALNEGAFMTMYRDHSNANAWWNPKFKSQFIEPMLHGLPTFVFSISCSTTRFDQTSYRCIVDAFCVKDHSGGIGGIGAATLTHSYFNDILAWGMFDCIWPDFMPELGASTPPPFVRPAYFLSEAKHYYAYHVFLPNWWPEVDQSQMNLFGYTGETYLNLFTEVPQPIEITHGLYSRANEEEFTITAEEGTIICLSKDGEILSVTESDGQIHTFFLPLMAAGEHFTITATKQNHFRYEYDVPIILSSGPYVTIERNGLLVENDYDVLHSGENAHIGLKLHNYGNDAASNVTITLTCESPYIEIEQGTMQYQNIAANQTVNIGNAFRVKIADDIPDMTEVTFTFHINDGNEKTINIVQNIAAPKFVIKPDITYSNSAQESILQLIKDDITDIHFRIANEGHFNSGPFLMDFAMPAPFITTVSPTQTFNSLEKGDSEEVVFRVQASHSQIDEVWVNAIVKISDGIHEAILDTLLPYGGFNESFDLNNLELNGWQMSGDAPWTITVEEYYNDGHSARSGVITHNQSSSMSITRTTQPTEISFFKKMSSESGYDKLHFYIDDQDLAEWSGISPWKQVKFIVPQGTHTFKWSYIKDHSVHFGEDCAWVDEINIMPGHTAIAYSGGTITGCTGESVHINCNYAYDYRGVEWTTEGDGSFDDINTLHPVYTPGANDIANGGATLQFRADNVFSPLQLILTDNIDLGDEIVGDDIINLDNTINHYSVQKINGVEYTWQLEPANAGFIIDHGSAIDIIWDFRHGITEAILTVTSEAGCVQETLSKTISISLVSVAEESLSSFSLYPNPTEGRVNLVMGQDLRGKSTVEVYNVLGTRLTSKTYRNLTKGQSIAFDLQHYAPGLYIIKLCNEEGCWSQKVSVR